MKFIWLFLFLPFGFAGGLGELFQIDCLPWPEVGSVIVRDNVAFVNYSDRLGHRVVMSTDGGETWQDYKTESGYIPSEWQTNTDALDLCLPDAPDICYRRGGNGIQRSTDGRKTRVANWIQPTTRLGFAERANNTILCNKRTIFTPDSLAVYSAASPVQAIATIANNGVISRSRDGIWQAHDVLEVHATPTYATSLLQAAGFVTLELLSGLLVTMSALGIFSWSMWNRIARATGKEPIARTAGWIHLPFTLGLLVSLVSCSAIPILAFQINLPESIQMLARAVFLALPFVLFGAPIVAWFVSWARAISIAASRAKTIRAALALNGTLVGGFLLAAASLLAWSFGAIPDYPPALGLACIILAAALYLALLQTRRFTYS